MPEKGKQDLPTEGTQTQKPVAFDLGKAAMPTEQPEVSRLSGLCLTEELGMSGI